MDELPVVRSADWPRKPRRPGPSAPFFAAVKSGNIAKATSELATRPELLNTPDLDGNPAVVTAAFLGDYAMTKMLIETGADSNATNANGIPVISIAILKVPPADVPQLAELLLAHGADPNLQGGEDRGSPLHAAVCVGNTSCVEQLLARGADPNMKNADGQTPLDLARALHESAAVALLDKR